MAALMSAAFVLCVSVARAAPVDSAVNDLLQQSQAAMENDQIARALSLAQRAQRIAPRDPRPWQQLANIHQRDGNAQLAASLRARAQSMTSTPSQESTTNYDSYALPDTHSDVLVEDTANPVLSATRMPKPITPVMSPSGRLLTTPVLSPIDALYTARSISNVRGGPGTQFDIVDQLNAKQAVHVAGRVRDSDWVLVSNDESAMGFVYFPLLVPADKSAERYSASKPSGVETSRVKTAVNAKPLLVEENAPLGSSSVQRSGECVDTRQTMLKPDGEIEYVSQRYCLVEGHWEAQR